MLRKPIQCNCNEVTAIVWIYNDNNNNDNNKNNNDYYDYNNDNVVLTSTESVVGNDGCRNGLFVSQRVGVNTDFERQSTIYKVNDFKMPIIPHHKH